MRVKDLRMNERIEVGVRKGYPLEERVLFGGDGPASQGIEDGYGKLIFCAVACCDPRLNIEQIFGIGTGMSSTSYLILFPS